MNAAPGKVPILQVLHGLSGSTVHLAYRFAVIGTWHVTIFDDTFFVEVKYITFVSGFVKGGGGVKGERRDWKRTRLSAPQGEGVGGNCSQGVDEQVDVVDNLTPNRGKRRRSA